MTIPLKQNVAREQGDRADTHRHHRERLMRAIAADPGQTVQHHGASFRVDNPNFVVGTLHARADELVAAGRVVRRGDHLWAASDAPESLPEPVMTRRQRIAAYLTENPHRNYREIAAATGDSESAVASTLTTMTRDRELQVDESTYPKRYRIFGTPKPAPSIPEVSDASLTTPAAVSPEAAAPSGPLPTPPHAEVQADEAAATPEGIDGVAVSPPVDQVIADAVVADDVAPPSEVDGFRSKLSAVRGVLLGGLSEWERKAHHSVQEMAELVCASLAATRENRDLHMRESASWQHRVGVLTVQLEDGERKRAELRARVAELERDLHGAQLAHEQDAKLIEAIGREVDPTGQIQLLDIPHVIAVLRANLAEARWSRSDLQTEREQLLGAIRELQEEVVAAKACPQFWLDYDGAYLLVRDGRVVAEVSLDGSGCTWTVLDMETRGKANNQGQAQRLVEAVLAAVEDPTDG